jgi:nucleoside-diphosphate-sugar epimerase
MTTVLVTGAGGHLGRRITRRLAADGLTVTAVVRRHVDSWPGGVTELVADAAHDRDAIQRATEGTTAVIHLAGASDAALRADPTRALGDSVRAAENVARANPPRLIYLSTVHVYGDSLAAGTRITESTPTAPRNDYARARLACEDIVRAAPAPTHTVIFRLTNGLGVPVDSDPDQSGWQVVANDLARRGATEGRLVLHSSGEQGRDFVPLVDVETALSTLAAADTSAPVQATYNFGAGESIPIRTLAEEIQDAFTRIEGSTPTLEIPAPTGPPSDAYRVDVTALRQLDLFVPTARSQAIDELVRDCLSRRGALSGHPS